MAERSVSRVDSARIRDRRPLQAEIREAILNDYILSGEVSPGSKLPSENELTAIFRASRVTIRGALQSLRDQGYIQIARGAGSRVLPRPETISSGIDRLMSFDEFARIAGRSISTVDVQIDTVDNTLPHTKVFDSASPITRVARTKMVECRRVGHIIDYVPESIIPGDRLRALFTDSVLDLLLEVDGLVSYTDCSITPVALDDHLAKYLDEPQNGAFLLMSELTRDDSGSLIDRSEAWLSPDYFSFTLRRRVSR